MCIVAEQTWSIERLSKTEIGTDVGDVTADLDNTFSVEGQGHNAALVGCSRRLT